MKIAVAGKGGSGKTTISGTLARIFAEEDEVIAIDADLNPNLGTTLGLPPEAFDRGEPLPRDLVGHTEGSGERAVLTRPLAEVMERYAVEAPAGISLLIMGRPQEAGFG